MNLISIVLAVAVFVLFFYQIVLQHRLEHDDTTDVANRKRAAKILLYVTLATFMGAQIIDRINDQEAARTISALRSDNTNLSLQISSEGSSSREVIKGVGQTVQGLTSTLLTNRSMDDVRARILEDKENPVIERRKTLVKRIESLDSEVVDLKTIRKGRELKRALQKLESEQAEIQRHQLAIQNRQEEEQAKQAAEQSRREAAEREVVMTEECLPVFDYVIKTLHEILVQIGKNTGESVCTDFPSQPTIYFSHLVSGGRIVSGKNSISLGTNEAWNFEFSISKATSTNIFFGPGHQLTITYQSKNGPAALTIQPLLAGPKIDTISISSNLAVANANQLHMTAGYEKELKQILKNVIDLQDEHFPLKLLTEGAK